MEPTAVTIRVPATSANLGPGFDCLGMALDVFASITVTFAEREFPPTDDVGEKMVLSAIRATYVRLGKEMPGVMARYTVSIPLGRGMGASAVARVAGVLAANQVNGNPLSKDECLAIAAELEGHTDNACPAMFGGIRVAVTAGDRILQAPCRYPGNLRVALLIPEHSIPTKDARKLLPESYSREDAVHNSSRLALLIAALAAGELGLLDEATQDRFHQPQRATLFPPMYDIFAAARDAGAYAAWLSGAGSTVAALCSEAAARPAAAAMLKVIEGAGMPGRCMVTRIAPTGAEVARVELAQD